jgi:hypothetical protein
MQDPTNESKLMSKLGLRSMHSNHNCDEKDCSIYCSSGQRLNNYAECRADSSDRNPYCLLIKNEGIGLSL